MGTDTLVVPACLASVVAVTAPVGLAGVASVSSMGFVGLAGEVDLGGPTLAGDFLVGVGCPSGEVGCLAGEVGCAFGDVGFCFADVGFAMAESGDFLVDIPGFPVAAFLPLSGVVVFFVLSVFLSATLIFT